MLGNRPETVRKRGSTNCEGLEKEATTLTESEIRSLFVLTLIYIFLKMLAGAAGEVMNTHGAIKFKLTSESVLLQQHCYDK